MSLKHLAIATPLACLACVSSPQSQALQGIWLSNGYGIGAQIKGQWVETFAVTNTTCLSEGSDPLFGLLAEFDITVADDGQSFNLSFEGTDQIMRFDRQPQLPSQCQTPPPNTPLGNFDVFADIFATHYAFFDVYGVDWDGAVAEARQQIKPETSEQELFAIFRTLLVPLRDGHIGLKAEINGTRQFFEPNPGDLFAKIKAEVVAAGQSPEDAEDAFRELYWEDHVPNTILGDQGQTVGNGFVQYGVIAPQTGYINFLTMAGYATGDIGDPLSDIAAINDIMDDVIASFEAAGVSHVIIDLSLNFGGFDDAALTIAGRFAAKPVFALSEYPADARDRIVLERNVTPSARPRYTGKLTVLTSDMTVSAGEIFVMGLRALPQTTHAGEATRGALSDVLEKELPNGWTIELSNEVYRDHEGVAWEGRGIRPERALQVFQGTDPLQTHAAAVMRFVKE